MLDRALRALLVVLNVFLAITAIIGGVWVIPALPQDGWRARPSAAFSSPLWRSRSSWAVVRSPLPWDWFSAGGGRHWCRWPLGRQSVSSKLSKR